MLATQCYPPPSMTSQKKLPDPQKQLAAAGFKPQGGQRMEISEELQCMSQGDNRRHNYPDAGHEHP